MASWEDSVLEGIRQLLELCWTHEPERIEQFLQCQYHNIWFRAFIHETVDYNNNYENLEYQGDAILKAVFPIMIMEMYPHLRESDMTNINNYYMSKNLQGQGELAMQMGLTEFIQVQAMDDFDITKLSVDVFESFFGALRMVGDKVGFGLGYIACYNMIKILFADVTIGDEIYGDAKTQSTQRLEQLGVHTAGKPTIKEFNEELGLRQHKVTLKIMPDQVTKLAEMGIKMPTTLAVVVSDPLSAARDEAYVKALAVLDKAGVTRKKAGEVSRTRKFNRIDSKIMTKTNAKAKRAGYSDLEFVNPTKTDTEKEYILLLIGKNKRGDKDILMSDVVLKGDGRTQNQVREDLLRKYVS